MMDFFKSKKPHLVMGIVNVTPDSFSDGGRYIDYQAAISHGLKLLEGGADILDIGGESSRPDAQIVDMDVEIARIVPVIEGLQDRARYISIDTRKAGVMRAAIAAGANFINDVSALRHDPYALSVAAETGLPVCLMHMKGTPQDMQKNPFYEDVVQEVYDFFLDRIEACVKGGVRRENIILDVGIGFGKTVHHNLELLKNLAKFKSLGHPLLLGVSRKSFIATLSRQEPAEQRLAGSLAAALWGVQNGIDILRVHDVQETVQALRVHQAISSLS